MNRVVIAGGGIAGLATALGLARAGLRAVVLERRPAFGELGAGIQLAPNAFKALDALGIGARVRAGAVLIDDLRLGDVTTGGTLVRLPLRGRFPDRFGAPYAVTGRDLLHGELLGACRSLGVELRTDAHVVGYRHGDAGVEAVLRSGERVAGAALVGADGLRSAVRAQLVHDGAPAASGHVSFRAVVPAGRAPGDLLARSAVLWAGPRCHLVHYPIAGGDRFNLVATYEDPACTPVSGQPVASEEVTARFPHPAAVPRAWLAAGTDWSKWVLCDRPPTRRWQDGAVVLAGDAAHPMLQYAAQGAAMALEDAACLAGHVDGPSPDYEKLFARYVEDRRERTARVQRVSRLLGERLYHVEGADARDRDALLARMTPDDLHAELGWLFGD